jgi:hypothetical protein
VAIARVWRIEQCAGRWSRLRCLRKAVASVAANGGVGDPITDARRVRRCGLIPVGEKWNPLESVGAAPKYIPPTWSGPHTSLRLIQAFKTLSAMPVANGPRFKSSWWPHHPMEWIDIKAKEHEYLNDLDQAREAVRQWARTRHRASPKEVSRTEAALSRPARYLHYRPLEMRVVHTVARFRFDRLRERQDRPLAQTRGDVRRINRAGLAPLLPGFAVTAWRCFDRGRCGRGSLAQPAIAARETSRQLLRP